MSPPPSPTPMLSISDAVIRRLRMLTVDFMGIARNYLFWGGIKVFGKV